MSEGPQQHRLTTTTNQSAAINDIILLGNRCQTQGPRTEISPAASFYVAPGGLNDMWSHFLQEIKEKYPVLLFWRFQLKWIHVVILEIFSYVQYFYTQINNNQMQRELFNNTLVLLAL